MVVVKNNELFLFVEITGNPNVGFKEEDIEGDFDPKKYDEAMQVILNCPNGKYIECNLLLQMQEIYM